MIQRCFAFVLLGILVSAAPAASADQPRRIRTTPLNILNAQWMGEWKLDPALTLEEAKKTASEKDLQKLERELGKREDAFVFRPDSCGVGRRLSQAKARKIGYFIGVSPSAETYLILESGDYEAYQARVEGNRLVIRRSARADSSPWIYVRTSEAKASPDLGADALRTEVAEALGPVKGEWSLDLPASVELSQYRHPETEKKRIQQRLDRAWMRSLRFDPAGPSTGLIENGGKKMEVKLVPLVSTTRKLLFVVGFESNGKLRGALIEPLGQSLSISHRDPRTRKVTGVYPPATKK